MTRTIHRDSGDKRFIARDLHPLEVGNYCIGTPAIEAFYDLVKSCMDHMITGALIYGPARIGKTRAIEYPRLAMAQNFAKVTIYHVQAEHKPKHAEGPFFTSLLEAVGCPEPDKGSNPSKRLKLIDRIKDACARNGSGVVAIFFDEAQRYGENEYEWLRDVHDHLDRINIRLFTFLIGQEELHAVKTAFQQTRKTQIVTRLMVEELRFHGLRIRLTRPLAWTATTPRAALREPTGASRDSSSPMQCTRATGWRTTRSCCAMLLRRCTTRTACRGNWRSRWSPSHARWRSCARVAGMATRSTSGPTKADGLPPSRPVATFRRVWPCARRWRRPQDEPWRSRRQAALLSDPWPCCRS